MFNCLMHFLNLLDKYFIDDEFTNSNEASNSINEETKNNNQENGSQLYEFTSETNGNLISLVNF